MAELSADKIDDKLHVVRTGRVVEIKEGSCTVISGHKKKISVENSPSWIKEDDKILYTLVEKLEDEDFDMGVFASDIEYGKVVHRNRLGYCIVKPKQEEKLVKVKKCMILVNENDRIPYILTHLRPNTDWGLFYDRRRHGSIVITSYGPTSPQGTSIGLIGYGDLYDKVEDILSTTSIPHEYNYNDFSERFDQENKFFICNNDYRIIPTGEKTILEKKINELSAYFNQESDYSIFLPQIKIDNSDDSNPHKDFAKKMRKMLKEYLLR